MINSTTPMSTVLDFESTLERLQVVIKNLENGSLALDVSLAQFEEGVRLSQACHQYLNAAEQKVDALMKAGETSPASASQTSENPSTAG